MKTIYLNSFQIHSYNSNIGYVVNKHEGLDFPEMRQPSYFRPGEYGAIVPNVLYGGRPITLTGTLFGTSQSDYELKRRNLENALGIIRDSSSVVQPITLKVTTMDDLQIQCACYPKQPKFDPIGLTGARFMIPLYAPDFFLLSQNESNSALTRASGGGLVIPAILPAVFSAQTGGSVIVTNNGTVEAYPTIYFNAPLTNPLIQNLTNGRYMQLNLTLTGSDQVVIDMYNKTIIKNGNQSVIGNKVSGSQFWWLEKGANTIKFLTDSASDTGNAQIKWRDSYLGI